MVRHLPFLFPRRKEGHVMSCCIWRPNACCCGRQASGRCPAIAALLNDFDVAKNLSRVPHPYSEADAEDFIATRRDRAAADLCVRDHAQARMGCIGGCGLQPEGTACSNSAIGWASLFGAWAMPAKRRAGWPFAFRRTRCAFLQAGWFHDNPASGRVLAKLGAVPSGIEHRDCLAARPRRSIVNMLLTRADFLRKQAA